MDRREKALGHNRGLNAMGAEVVNSTFVFLLSLCNNLNICASNSPLRQALFVGGNLKKQLTTKNIQENDTVTND